MRSLWLLVVLAAGVAARPHRGYGWASHRDDDDSDEQCRQQEEEALAQSREIDQLTHQLRQVADLVETMPQPHVIGLDMAEMDHQLDEIEGNMCKPYSEFSCRTDIHKCISSLLVCDGKDDCGNNADEQTLQCDVEEAAGTIWRGDLVYDHCTSRKPKVIELRIDSVVTVPYFTSRPKFEGHLLIEHHTARADSWTNFLVSGYWNPAQRALVVHPPENDGLGLSCVFHGHAQDTCIGYVFRQVTLETCAEFIFHKTQ